jgi:3'-phosphoadenosine 5'-phosphosulfate sulfotransferase (PAPS reductase)/FAD synthetase
MGAEDVRHVVLFSGGIGSWAAAKRVAAKHGTEHLLLLFTDTKSEDKDTYRFLREGAENVGGALVWLTDGRTIWDVFEEREFLSNNRVDHCSQYLKREQSQKWVRDNCNPDQTVIYVGIDWSEAHRFRRLEKHWKPYRIEAPMTEAPFLTKQELIQWAEREGIRNQYLYEEGFKHDNCGGFCVKMGHAGAKHLLRMRP